VRLDWGAKDGVKSMRIGFTYQRLTAHGGLAILTRFITERGLRSSCAQCCRISRQVRTGPALAASAATASEFSSSLICRRSTCHQWRRSGVATASLRVGLPAVWLKTAAQENRRQAQGGECGPLRLVESALQTDAQVVGAVGKMTGCFCRPKRAATQSLQAKLSTAIRPLNLSKFGTVDSRSLYFLARRKPHSAIPLSPRRIRPSLP
jgi:hypothetical protein